MDRSGYGDEPASESFDSSNNSRRSSVKQVGVNRSSAADEFGDSAASDVASDGEGEVKKALFVTVDSSTAPAGTIALIDKRSTVENTGQSMGAETNRPREPRILGPIGQMSQPRAEASAGFVPMPRFPFIVLLIGLAGVTGLSVRHRLSVRSTMA